MIASTSDTVSMTILLRQICLYLVDHMREGYFLPAVITDQKGWKEFHGFRKKPILQNVLQDFLRKKGLAGTADIQAEIVEVKSAELKHHLHNHAHAYIYVLGKSEYAPEADRALAYHDDDQPTRWRRISSGMDLNIPPKTSHGFARGQGGAFFFLSIQSPRIDQRGHEDYVETS